MRIAHVSDCYLPRTGGIELQVRGLSQAQFAAGEAPRIFTATPARKGQAVIPDETDDGVPIFRLAYNLPASVPISAQIGPKLARRLMAEADVVHVHGGLISPFAWPALRTTVKAGLPVVVTVHSVWANWAKAFAVMDKVSNWRSWPVIWTTVSEMAAEPLQRALGDHSQVRILPNGIDITKWRTDALPPVAHDGVTIISVARLALRKRSDALVKVLAEARRQVPAEIPMRALLVGDGPDRTKIERMIRDQKLDWVQCVGWKNHDEIRQLYTESDIYVSASILESFGIAALEARTYGLAVVAHGQSGMREFIHEGQEGLLASTDSDMAKAVASLVSNPALLKKITDFNRANEPEFGWPKVIQTANDQYRDAKALLRR